tara:strand:+ start:992 stop:1552 length:561 start_codon:yes stop_codon:yes gene_type:complete
MTSITNEVNDNINKIKNYLINNLDAEDNSFCDRLCYKLDNLDFTESTLKFEVDSKSFLQFIANLVFKKVLSPGFGSYLSNKYISINRTKLSIDDIKNTHNDYIFKLRSKIIKEKTKFNTDEVRKLLDEIRTKKVDFKHNMIDCNSIKNIEKIKYITNEFEELESICKELLIDKIRDETLREGFGYS